MYSIYIKGAHGRTDINNPHKVAYGQDRDGYYRVVLSDHGKHDRKKIHQLVVEQFIGDVPEGYVINHIDGDKHNNHYQNLEIVTVTTNNRHAWNTGLNSSEKNPNAIKVDVYDHKYKKQYKLNSLKSAHEFTDVGIAYISRLRNNEQPLFSHFLFKKVQTGDGRMDYCVECYYNGELLKTFDNNKDAGAYFGKSGHTIYSAYNSKYSMKLNRYTFTFPNVSTIENTNHDSEVSRVHDQ